MGVGLQGIGELQPTPTIWPCMFCILLFFKLGMFLKWLKLSKFVYTNQKVEQHFPHF